jgi:large subunit ribosomal protein L35
MPKAKVRSSAKKRFHLTGTGKVKRASAYRSHILTSKSTKRKRHLRRGQLVAPTDVRQVKMMLQK